MMLHKSARIILSRLGYQQILWSNSNNLFATCTTSKNVSDISTILQAYFAKYHSEFVENFTHLSEKVSSTDSGNIKANLEQWSKLKLLLDLNDKLELLRNLESDSVDLLEELDDGSDSDFRHLAQHEVDSRTLERKHLELQIADLLLPPDKFANCPSVNMELIAGAGGLEAAMFARDLFNMYQALANERGWLFIPEPDGNSSSANETEPIHYMNIRIDSMTPNDFLYARLRWEAGVHRVQRVPTNSKMNKIHTSTVAVTILPAVDDGDLKLNPDDLKWDFFRSSGAGGQHVNKTESAVRVRHKPTGIIAACQNERSQHQNKHAALEMLKAKISKSLVRQQIDSENTERKSQMGSLARSDRIRTYNFPQDRVTDHRLGRSWNNLSAFMRQAQGLEDIATSINEVFKVELLRNLRRPHFLL